MIYTRPLLLTLFLCNFCNSALARSICYDWENNVINVAIIILLFMCNTPYNFVLINQNAFIKLNSST